jgi:hypothetical protein
MTEYMMDYAETLIKIKAVERRAYEAALGKDVAVLEECADLFIEYALDLHVYCIAHKKSRQA